jgi:hypothetical protein
MMREINMNRSISLERFLQARKKARRDALAARLKGQDANLQLLPFDVIRSELRQQSPFYRGIQEVPIDQIVGSVGRYNEFTRHFLPLNDSLAERWVGVDTLARAEGWPPVELYKVGNAYFVRDGNHRVSVARQMDTPTIEAHVWEYPDDLEIGPNDTLDDVLIRLGERNFFEKTHLDEMYPDHNLHFTVPGRHTEMLVQIYDLQKKLAVIDGEMMPFEEAVAAWYEMIYLPTIQIIRESGLLKEFPGRTEADLFGWLSKHRDALRKRYGDYESLHDLAAMLVQHYKEGTLDKAARQIRRLLGSNELPPLPEALAADVDEEE